MVGWQTSIKTMEALMEHAYRHLSQWTYHVWTSHCILLWIFFLILHILVWNYCIAQLCNKAPQTAVFVYLPSTLGRPCSWLYLWPKYSMQFRLRAHFFGLSFSFLFCPSTGQVQDICSPIAIEIIINWEVYFFHYKIWRWYIVRRWKLEN